MLTVVANGGDHEMDTLKSTVNDIRPPSKDSFIAKGSDSDVKEISMDGKESSATVEEASPVPLQAVKVMLR
ncbi:unnamed protein product [Toxocara canis]|uniref:Uncharacterized protein n=1 Tax=Toxocara canis TaxID=6265 RepID=A0A183VEZ0_TOXCA|nr:unnamed protein product [Toxocara canis]